MTTKPAHDDLEAVRAVAAALESFSREEQERVIRWAREKLGLSQAPATTPIPPAAPPPGHGLPVQPTAVGSDIKSFVGQKAPQSDTHFAATVAYYYRFQAPEAQRKDSINSDDLQEACRQAGRNRLKRPIATLSNALRDGLLDKAERGTFKLNSVGENLVAMALPAAGGKTPLKRRAKSKVQRKGGKKAKK